MSNLKTSKQASKEIGTVNRNSLVVYINRHVELKPAIKLDSGEYLWTEEEIKRVIARKDTHRSGRPSKK